MQQPFHTYPPQTFGASVDLRSDEQLALHQTGEATKKQ